MFFGSIILVIVLLFHLVGCSALLGRRFKVAYFFSIVAGTLGVCTFFLFLYLFISNSFVFRAVYENSSVSLPLLLKLSASWTNAAGSLLLWLSAMSLAMIIHRLKAGRSLSDQDRVAALVMSIFTVAILVLIFMVNPFSELPLSPHEGRGLNPTLQTSWSVIHPPLIFSAYSTILLSYSLLIGKRWANLSGDHTENSCRMLRISWVLLTVGISLGSAWAYETLGWGGYWAWDPLETSALIPWLSLTALLFARPIGDGNDYALFATTFSASTLLYTVYIARSTLAPSVHGYGNFAGGIAILLLTGLPVLISLIAKRRGRLEEPTPRRGRKDSPAIALAFWALILLASANLILLLNLSFSPFLGRTLYTNTGQHNYASFPFLMVFIAVMIAGCEKRRPLIRDVFRVCVLLLAVGTALALVNWPTESVLANLGLPFVIGLLVAAAYCILKSAVRKPKILDRYSTVRYLTLLGIAILLLGVFISSSMQFSTAETVRPGQSLNVFGLKFLHIRVTTFPSDRVIFFPPHGSVPEIIVSKVTYNFNGEPEGSRTLLLSYYPAFDRFVPTPAIYRFFTEDIYVSANPTESVKQASAWAFANGTVTTPADIRITVTRIPAVSFVWLGIMIMISGNVPLLIHKP